MVARSRFRTGRHLAPSANARGRSVIFRRGPKPGKISRRNNVAFVASHPTIRQSKRRPRNLALVVCIFASALGLAQLRWTFDATDRAASCRHRRKFRDHRDALPPMSTLDVYDEAAREQAPIACNRGKSTPVARNHRRAKLRRPNFVYCRARFGFCELFSLGCSGSFI